MMFDKYNYVGGEVGVVHGWGDFNPSPCSSHHFNARCDMHTILELHYLPVLLNFEPADCKWCYVSTQSLGTRLPLTGLASSRIKHRIVLSANVNASPGESQER